MFFLSQSNTDCNGLKKTIFFTWRFVGSSFVSINSLSSNTFELICCNSCSLSLIWDCNRANRKMNISWISSVDEFFQNVQYFFPPPIHNILVYFVVWILEKVNWVSYKKTSSTWKNYIHCMYESYGTWNSSRKASVSLQLVKLLMISFSCEKQLLHHPSILSPIVITSSHSEALTLSLSILSSSFSETCYAMEENYTWKHSLAFINIIRHKTLVNIIRKLLRNILNTFPKQKSESFLCFKILAKTNQDQPRESSWL